MTKFGIKVFINGKWCVTGTTNDHEHARELAEFYAKQGFVASIVKM